MIKGEAVSPKAEAKILGVVMDCELRYKNHIADTATKSLNAALALKRLKMLSPSVARQLFSATVAPIMDYASNVWMHACTGPAKAALDRAQRVGAQAIVGAFQTVAVAIAEAEACIRPIYQRHCERATRMWIGIQTLPNTHPLRRLGLQTFRRFTSPLQKIAQLYRSRDEIETIQAYPIQPWEKRIDVVIKPDRQEAAQAAKESQGIIIATCSSERNSIVGMGGAICDTTTTGSLEAGPTATYTATLGPRDRQNSYVAELVAIATALRSLVAYLSLRSRLVIILTSNLSALLVINRPKQQSGQLYISQIYELVHKLRGRGNRILALWVPAQEEIVLKTTAKVMARQATELGQPAQKQRPGAKSTVLNLAIARLRQERTLPPGVGKYTREMDTALPGKHTRSLYDGFKRIEASVLAQLRTGMARLNGYLYQIGALESDLCDCRQAKETVEHFLFRCTKWDQHRECMLHQTETRRGCLSFYLGGKALSDPAQWKPNLSAVRATVQYAIATGRLKPETERLLGASQ